MTARVASGEATFLERLFARDFRSYHQVDVAFDQRLNVFVGPNGAGKTNLLEAIHYLGIGSSFRARRDGDAVRWGASGFRVKGRRRDGLGTLDVEVVVRPGIGKSVRVGGRSLTSTAELHGVLPCVSFIPDDLQWAKGPPEARRRWLDRLLCQTSRAYAEALSAFRQALAQRNTLLQEGGARGPSRELLAAWTDEYLDRAAPVAAVRARELAAIASLVEEEMAQLGSESVSLAIDSQPGGAAAPETPGDWREHYRRQLGELAAAERHRGHTLSGPHRDDVRAEFAARDARRYASQGQQRALVVALKLAEVRYVAARLGRSPLLLLDDVFSELDPVRRGRLAETAMLRTQTFLTTTEEGLVPGSADAKIFHVRDGDVFPAAG